MAIAVPNRDRNCHPIVHDCLGARNIELIDAAVDHALGAKRLVNYRGIEVDLSSGRLSSLRCGGLEWRFALRESNVQVRGELHGIAMAANMHIRRCRRRPQQVVVKSRNVDAALDESSADAPVTGSD
jgi:hypothetical protein